MNKGITVIALAANASALLGRTIQSDYVYGVLHEMEQNQGHYGSTKKVSPEQSRVLLAYLADWYGRKDRPSILEWLDRRGEKAPKPYQETLPVIVKAKAIARANQASPAIMASFQKRLEKLERVIESGNEPQKQKTVLQIESDSLHKKINHFVFNNPVDVRTVWNMVRDLFGSDLGGKINLANKQSLPDWARDNGFYADLQNKIDVYLGIIEDSLKGQNRLAGL